MFEQTIKNFNINLNALNARNSLSSGDLVTGHISFELTKETKITSITMAVKGKVDVHWSTGGGGGRKRRRRRTISAKLEYFSLKSAILQESRVTGGTAKLQPGTHVYPFTCQLPNGNFPSAFSGVHGKIVYSLTVGINRPWHMSKDYATELNFVNHIDTNQPEMRAPLSGTNSTTLCCLWCASGPITLVASTEKKAFVPGETVKIICMFSNTSSRTAIPKVKLRQEQVFYTHGKAQQRMISKTLSSVTGQPVSPQTSDLQTELMITIPPSASHTISNCSLIDVHYLIEMSLVVMGSHDLTVLFPIILCDTPVNTNLPPSL